MVLGNEVSGYMNIYRMWSQLIQYNSTDKSRKFGWFGHVDSIESMHEVFEKLAQMKMIPPMVK